MVKTFGQKNDFIKEHIFSTPSLAMRAYQDLTHRAPPPLIREKGQTIALYYTYSYRPTAAIFYNLIFLANGP